VTSSPTSTAPRVATVIKFPAADHRLDGMAAAPSDAMALVQRAIERTDELAVLIRRAAPPPRSRRRLMRWPRSRRRWSPSRSTSTPSLQRTSRARRMRVAPHPARRPVTAPPRRRRPGVKVRGRAAQIARGAGRGADGRRLGPVVESEGERRVEGGEPATLARGGVPAADRAPVRLVHRARRHVGLAKVAARRAPGDHRTCPYRRRVRTVEAACSSASTSSITSRTASASSFDTSDARSRTLSGPSRSASPAREPDRRRSAASFRCRLSRERLDARLGDPHEFGSDTAFVE
jgi:hypothetical protein